MQRPMTPVERELMLSICATCFAINEQTSLSASMTYNGHGTMEVSVRSAKDFDDSKVLFCNSYSRMNPHLYLMFSVWYPDNVPALTTILNRLLSYLPGTEALVLPVPVVIAEAA